MMDDKPHYGRGMHPNSLKALEKNRKEFNSNDGRAVRAGKASSESKRAWKTISTIITTELNKEGGKLKELLGKRVLKMALEGNLPAIQYVVRLIGEEPAEKVDITTADFSALDRAMEALDIPAGSRDAP